MAYGAKSRSVTNIPCRQNLSVEFIEGKIEGREGREGEKGGERIKGLVTSSEEQGGKTQSVIIHRGPRGE